MHPRREMGRRMAENNPNIQKDLQANKGQDDIDAKDVAEATVEGIDESEEESS